MQLAKSIILEVNNIERKFSSFWLKSVEDVDLGKHCINCLKGERVPMKQSRGFGVVLAPDKVWYLCGVTYPYVWKNNFHLAFEYSPGDIVYVRRQGVTLTVRDAKEIPITPDYIDNNLPQAQDPKFNTCRNWQFANYFAKTHKKAQQTLF